MRRIVVVGASLAGVRAAQALRELGFDGELVIVGDEDAAPYDRPPLTKDFLAGRVDAADLALLTEAEHGELGATWWLGRRADALDRRRVSVGGEALDYDGLVIATGSRARPLPRRDDATGAADAARDGVHVLRTLDDARSLRAALAHARRVVVVGGGFIGTEIASTAALAHGAQVTVVEPAGVPLASRLGASAAGVWSAVAERHGVAVRAGIGVVDVRPGPAVALTDGSVLAADVVVVGVGARPNTDWLAGSGLEVSDGVHTDAWGRTSWPGVVAAGDVARFTYGGQRRRVEHWTNARDMPAVAARALLGADPGRPHDRAPYVWTDQFGQHVQLVGDLDPKAPLDVVDGALADERFVAVHRRGGRVRGVLGWNSPKEFTRLRRRHDAEIRPRQP